MAGLPRMQASSFKFVVDTGHVKQRVYNRCPRTGLDTLAVMPVSQAQAGQRTGRAGRESAGTCYRLYQELAFDGLPASTTPEILRVRTGLKLHWNSALTPQIAT